MLFIHSSSFLLLLQKSFVNVNSDCIFKEMKISAHIFSAAFILIFGLLNVQPLFINYRAEKAPMCAKSKCHKKKMPAKNMGCGNERDCNNKACNPFLPCATGSCCYIVENFFTYTTISFAVKEKIALFNDNRLLNKLSECWHPPESVS